MTNTSLLRLFTWLGRIISIISYVWFISNSEIDVVVRMAPLALGTFAPLIFGKALPLSIHALVSGILTLAMVGGVYGLFTPGLLFDDFMHIATPIVVALTLTFLLKNKFARNKALAFISITAISVTIEVFWEIFEAAVLLITHKPFGDEPFDTALDLTLAVIGSLIGVLIGLI